MSMVPCPCCSTACDDAHYEHRYSAYEAAQHFVLAQEHPQRHADLVGHIQHLWAGEECRLLTCGVCGLRFAWPFVAGDGRFYNLAYPHSDYPRQRWEFDLTASSLKASPPPSGPVLEVGSGFGHFLRLISPRLVDPGRVLAVEYNDRARARLSERGFQAFGEDIRTPAFDRYRGQLAAVFMFQVIEHMDDLDGLTQRISELAQTGAMLYLAVPNAFRIRFNEQHNSLRDMPPNHISLWTEGAFTALARRAGWTVMDWRLEPTRWRPFLRQDLIYSHMQRAQRAGSMANRIRALPRSGSRRLLEAAASLLAAPARLPAWLSACSSGTTYGDSAWIRIRIGSGT